VLVVVVTIKKKKCLTTYTAVLPNDAAHILGVEKQLGTIAPRKAAHLVVMDGDFHQPATQVRYVFADGVRFEYETKPKTAKAETKSDKPDKPAKSKKPAETKGPEPATEIEADSGRPGKRRHSASVMNGMTG